MRMLRKLAMRMRLAMRMWFINRWLWFNYLAVFMDSVHAVRFRMPINFTVFFIDIMVMPETMTVANISIVGMKCSMRVIFCKGTR